MDRVESAERFAVARRLTRALGSGEPRLRSHPWLVALCVLLPGVEVGVLLSVGLRGALPFAPQVTAPAPYGLFHDLRFLYVYHSSWLTFALGSTALLVWRGGLDALTVLLAWPRDMPRPSVPSVLRRCAAFTLVAGFLLTPSAVLLAGMGITPVSYLLFGGLPVVIVVAALTPHGPVSSWWRTHPPWRAVGWSLLAFVVLTVGGGLLAAAPTWATPPIAMLTGLFDAWAWMGVARSIAGRRRVLRPVPLVPASLVAMGVVIVLGITLALQLKTAAHQAEQVASAVSGKGRPVLLVSGFGTAWNGDQRPVLGSRFSIERFSYRGMDTDGRPLPYARQATYRSLDTSVGLMARQVREFSDRRGRPVSIVASSEGALIAASYLAAHPDAPVSHLVLLSPLVSPGRTYIAPPGTNGWGIATSEILQRLGQGLAATTPLRISADEPFIRSLDDHGPALAGLLACPSPHVKTMALFPLADAVAAPYPVKVGMPVGVVPGMHGTLLDEHAVRDAVAAFLTTGEMTGHPFRSATEQVIRAAAAPWQAPTLSPSLVPVWQGQHVANCAARQEVLTSWLAPPA